MQLDFKKGNGLVPVVIQHFLSKQVLMLGYMNKAALAKTKKEKRVTLYSRSKKRLWTKGETSGNFLEVESIAADCDQDTLLILARPLGPTCHTGQASCFGQREAKGFVYELQDVIEKRIEDGDADSYTRQLFDRGINKIAQKVGEEAVELVIEAKDDNRDFFVNEAADLLYHYLILLKAKNIRFEDVEASLLGRSKG
ncbi:MAG: bifunctional phosphoribosyl-AMP cyclohydrolase/phosphoribosyl-ATP diphosphatase HisIE [Flavobacteriales bacterium]|nr:bifunctional phosphoribosyl-AMP cyclohydrolase/phosphoribosyl-ATP diphosphatase HisIE [Flavobacteriales bacterium]